MLLNCLTLILIYNHVYSVGTFEEADAIVQSHNDALVSEILATQQPSGAFQTVSLEIESFYSNLIGY